MDQNLGTIDFCPNCRRKIDAALESSYKEKIYIAINRTVKAPNNRVPILVCGVCQKLLTETLGIDGFEVVLS